MRLGPVVTRSRDRWCEAGAGGARPGPAVTGSRQREKWKVFWRADPLGSSLNWLFAQILIYKQSFEAANLSISRVGGLERGCGRLPMGEAANGLRLRLGFEEAPKVLKKCRSAEVKKRRSEVAGQLMRGTDRRAFPDGQTRAQEAREAGDAPKQIGAFLDDRQVR